MQILKLVPHVELVKIKLFGEYIIILIRICSHNKVSMPSPEDLIMSVEGRVRDSGLCLILEPGRSMVANSCLLVTRVLGVKKNDKTK